MNAGEILFICILCFTAGGCLGVLVIVCSQRPGRGVLLGWLTYLALCMGLAVAVGKAVLL